MKSVYESIMTGLNEAIEDAQSEGKKLNRRTVTIIPVKEYGAEQVRNIRNSVGMSQSTFCRLSWCDQEDSGSLGSGDKSSFRCSQQNFEYDGNGHGIGRKISVCSVWNLIREILKFTAATESLYAISTNTLHNQREDVAKYHGRLSCRRERISFRSKSNS